MICHAPDVSLTVCAQIDGMFKFEEVGGLNVHFCLYSLTFL